MINNKYIFLLFLFAGLNRQDKGQKLFQEKKYAEARKYYETVLGQRNDDKAALFGLGSSAYYQNDIEAALNSFGNTLDSEDKELSSNSYYNIARILQDKNELEQSLAFYRKSLELNPDDIDTKINYELLKNKMDQSQKQENNQNQKNDDKQSEENQKNQDQSNKKDGENNQKDQSKPEEEKSKKEQGDKNDMVENNSKNQDELSEKNKENNKTEQSSEPKEYKSDQLMQAEAILNALKDQEKFNQKQKISKIKSLKFDKDW